MTAIDAKEHQDKICEKHGKYVSQHIQLGKVCDFWSRCSECEAGKKREEEALRHGMKGSVDLSL